MYSCPHEIDGDRISCAPCAVEKAEKDIVAWLREKAVDFDADDWHTFSNAKDVADLIERGDHNE